MGRVCNYLANKLLNHALGAEIFTPPETLYVGLHKASVWLANHAYSSGDFVVPTVNNGRCYKCTTGGTSGGTEPTWGTTDGGTTNDGTAVFTEQSTAFNGGTFPAELDNTGYARKSVTNNTTNLPSTSTRVKSNGTAIQFAELTAGTNDAGVAVLYDAATSGNPFIWGIPSTIKSMEAGDFPYLKASSISATLN
jgi:hypothetical protein